MQLSSGYEARRARIEIVPLIDVVFLLLVFFIYAMLSMTVYRGIQVDLPRAAGAAEEGEILVIALSAANVISIGGRVLAMEQAVAEVVQRSGTADLPVFVRGDRRADLGIAIELLARLKEAGLTSVAFQVEGKE
jgi:biopolymer transport protein ExbD